jgi:hypothetical protein
MTEIITSDALDKFEQITSYDIRSFFINYLDFNDSHYSNIVNFFAGVSNVTPTESIDLLNYLIKEQKKIIDVTILNAVSLDNYEFWALVEYVEDIGHTLETTSNVSKWLRSSITKDGYKQQVIVEHMTSQHQGLEDVERKVLASNNPRDSWVDTALENQLTEEDYTLDGGYLIKIIYKNNNALFLEGVVDNIDEPKKTYGLDINRRIMFENSDIAVLSYEDTIRQCAEILTGLKRGDDPVFPDRGVNVKAIVGNSIAAIYYPAIFRDLAAVFATDDSFKSLFVTDIRREADAILLDFTVETKAGDVFNKSVQL